MENGTADNGSGDSGPDKVSVGDVGVPVDSGTPCRRCGHVMRSTASFCVACGSERPKHLMARRRAFAKESRQHWDAVKKVIIFYVVMLAVIVPMAWASEEYAATADLVAGIVSAAVIVVVACMWREPLLQTLKINSAVIKYIPLTIILTLGLLAVNLGYFSALFALFPGIEEYKYSTSFNDAGYSIWVQFYAIALMPAIWEEIAFRGLIQSRLQHLLTVREAWILTAILFGIIHCSLWATPILILIGLALGWLRIKSNSLLPGMLLHGLHNAGILWMEYI